MHDLYRGGDMERRADLRAAHYRDETPAHYRDETPLEPLAAWMRPPARDSWLEPVQAFVLHYEAAPRSRNGGAIDWEIGDKDGRAETIARWQRTAEDERYDESTLEYILGTDPETGKPVKARYPGEPSAKTTWEGAGGDNFLTPVIFRREVLDAYLADTHHYTVEERQLSAGYQWSIPYAITANGHVQVRLGDLGRISDRAQQHWQQHNIADDDGPPKWRLEQDLGAEFVDRPHVEAVDRLRAAIERCNAATHDYCGVPLYAAVEGLSADRARTLRVPLNPSLPAFQDQITTLAIVLIEHIDVAFLDAVGAPKASGTLARLAGWLEAVTSSSAVEAKAMIDGLYATQAIRSTAGGAHRGGAAGLQAFERSEIELDDLPGGFERLVVRATDNLEALAATIDALPPLKA